MFDLFLGMMKEEWRIHSTIFGNLGFALFPILIFAISFMGSFIVIFIRNAIPLESLVLIIHSIFVLLGFMVGSFGILGREFMNRRFGQASLLAYSARSLPIMEQAIFLNFVLKDILYYFILWVLPFGMGFLVASPFIGVNLYYPLLLLLTLTLSFLSGLVLVFFLSTVYAHGRVLFVLVMGIFIALFAGMIFIYGTGPGGIFPPLVLFYNFSLPVLGISVISIIVPFALSVVFLTTEYTGTEKRYKNIFLPLSNRLEFMPFSGLMAKDMIDLYRSGTGVGQTIFSYILPLCLIWLVLSVLSNYIPTGNLFLVFAVLVGVISSTIYTWITEFDNPRSYMFLPVSVSMVIRAKISVFAIIQVVPVIFILYTSITGGVMEYLVPAIFLCIPVSFFAASLMIHLCGLSPGILIYNVRILLLFIVVMAPVLLILISISFISPYYSLAGVLLAVPSIILVRRGFVKWDGFDYPGF